MACDCYCDGQSIGEKSTRIETLKFERKQIFFNKFRNLPCAAKEYIPGY